jgi:hypothetical protein
MTYPLVRKTIVQYQHLFNYLTGRISNNFIKVEMQHLLQQSKFYERLCFKACGRGKSSSFHGRVGNSIPRGLESMA